MNARLNKGFTLVEIAVTVIVLGAMAALAIPTYHKYVTIMKVEEGKKILLSLLNAQKMYYSDNKMYTTDITKLKLEFDSSPQGFQPPFIENSDSYYLSVPTIVEKDGLYTLRINADGKMSCTNAPGKTLCRNFSLPNTFVNSWVVAVCPMGQQPATNCSGFPGTHCCLPGKYWKGSCADSCSTGSGGGGGCFLSGTMITMGDGTQKVIEDIKIGDIVLAYDEVTKQMKPDKVVQTFFHPKDNIYGIVNGHLKVTPNHRVLSKGKWVHIGDLRVGDTLTDINGRDVPIETIEIVREKMDVYNFEVNPFHTYVADGFVVHNFKEEDRTPDDVSGRWW